MSNITLSMMDNVTNPMQIYTVVDTWANNLLSYSILVTIFIIVAIILINQQYKFFSALSYAFASVLPFCFLFWVGSILPPTLLIIDVVLLAVCLALVKFTE